MKHHQTKEEVAVTKAFWTLPRAEQGKVHQAVINYRLAIERASLALITECQHPNAIDSARVVLGIERRCIRAKSKRP